MKAIKYYLLIEFVRKKRINILMSFSQKNRMDSGMSFDKTDRQRETEMLVRGDSLTGRSSIKKSPT